MERFKEIAIEVSLFSRGDQHRFLDELFSHLPPQRRMELAERTMHLTMPRSRWMEIEDWMERRIAKKYDMTPNQLAGVCMNYMKIDHKMRPLMVKLARKVKDRVRKRNQKGGSLGGK